jgi:hypothetical protein
MRRLGLIVDVSGSRIGHIHWTIREIERQRERRGYGGECESFDPDILSLRAASREDGPRELVIVTDVCGRPMGPACTVRNG